MERSGESPTNPEEKSSEEQQIWCLQRVGRDRDWLQLYEDTEVTLGRGLGVTHQILSLSAPLMISRNHCVFRRGGAEAEWTVTDNKSLNGVWVNGRRLVPERACALRRGDSIRLGVSLEGEEVEFHYVLVRCSYAAAEHFLSRDPPPAAAHSKSSKRKLDGEEAEPRHTQSKLCRRSAPPLERSDTANPLPPPVRNDTPSCSAHQLTTSRREGEEHLEELRGHLRSQREEPQESVPEEQRLEREEGLKKQLEEALSEKHRVREELAHAQQGFSALLQAKDQELQLSKEEKEKARAQTEEVVVQMTEVLESELQCSICSELFIQAVTLSCAHSFCQHCIQAWLRRKDKCPMCWQGVTSLTRSLVLDSCIDRMLDRLSAALRERRHALLQQRRSSGSDTHHTLSIKPPSL